MTLTTEQLRARIGHLKERLRDMNQHKYPDDCPNATAYLESLKSERQQDIALLEELLASREAQPVFFIEIEGDDWINAGRIQGKDRPDLGLLPDGINYLYATPPAPAIPDIGSSVVNDAAWKLHDTLTEHGPLNGHQFNNLKGCLYEALKIVMSAPPAPAVPDDYFGELVKKARSAADKAMRKFPQPNYVLNKVAEESGEVIKAVIHYTEGREEWANVEGEIIDNLAMLIRLVVEGDQVIGFTPPVACHGAILPAPHDPDPIDVFVAQVCGDLSAGHQR